MSDEVPWDGDQFSVGSHVAGYQLEAQLGRGGMAAVYRAHDLRLDRRVALKILAPSLARDEAFRRRFIRESRAAAAVDHPHIIPIFDAGEASGVLYIAMRYVQEGDLRRLLDRVGVLPAARMAQIVAQTASALDAAHAHGLVHRDVKPANILLDTATGHGQLDHVYLSDFGLSKQLRGATALTATGQFLGTLDYVAPEQIQGHQVDGRADEYALACAAFEMLCDKPPFERDQHIEVLWAQISEPPPLLTSRRPDLPLAVDQVMATALAKSPDDRYARCGDFAMALRTACGLDTDDSADAGGPAKRPRTEPSMPIADADAGGPAKPPRTELSGPAAGAGPGRPGPATDDRPADRGLAAGPATGGITAATTRPADPGSRSPLGPPQSPYSAPRDGEPAERPWWRSRAVPFAAGIVVVGLAGAAFAISTRGTGSTHHTTSFAAPACTTTVVTAAARPLASVRTDMVRLPAKPFAVATTQDNRWDFVTFAGTGVAVMRNGNGLAPTFVRRYHIPGSRGGTLTHDGRHLLVASRSGAVVINVADAEGGSSDPVAGMLSDKGSVGGSDAIQVAVSPDDKFAFVTLWFSGHLAVFNLQAALANGFGPSNLVGTVPLGVKPEGMQVSADGQWLYVTSNRRTPTSGEGTLSVLNLHRVETRPATAVSATVTAGCDAARVINPGDGSVVWVTARKSNALLGFSAAKLLSDPGHALIARLQVGTAPNALLSIDQGKRILVTDSNYYGVNGATPDVLVIDNAAALANRPAVLGAIRTGLEPWDFSLASRGKTLLVTNTQSRQLEAVDITHLP